MINIKGFRRGLNCIFMGIFYEILKYIWSFCKINLRMILYGWKNKINKYNFVY